MVISRRHPHVPCTCTGARAGASTHVSADERNRPRGRYLRGSFGNRAIFSETSGILTLSVLGNRHILSGKYTFLHLCNHILEVVGSIENVLSEKDVSSLHSVTPWHEIEEKIV